MINKSSVPREVVKKVEQTVLKDFRAMNGRNPTAKEARERIATVHREAEKLNRRGRA